MNFKKNFESTQCDFTKLDEERRNICGMHSKKTTFLFLEVISLCQKQPELRTSRGTHFINIPNFHFHDFASCATKFERTDWKFIHTTKSLI